jgi:phosphoglycolate phosphatase-like HAD superfamily hydrolase
MVKAIIFDFDGVLVDSVNIKTKAFARLFEAEGREAVRQVVDYHVKNGGMSRFSKFKHIYKNILSRRLDKYISNDLSNKFSAMVKEEVVNAPYIKGAREFLDRYSSSYKCFISSATPQGETEEIIKKRGMGNYFCGIFGSPKEKINIVRDILKIHGISPREAIYIGDALSDLRAASANGVRFIAVVNNDGYKFTREKCIKMKDLRALGLVINDKKSFKNYK